MKNVIRLPLLALIVSVFSAPLSHADSSPTCRFTQDANFFEIRPNWRIPFTVGTTFYAGLPFGKFDEDAQGYLDSAAKVKFLIQEIKELEHFDGKCENGFKSGVRHKAVRFEASSQQPIFGNGGDGVLSTVRLWAICTESITDQCQ